MRCSMPHNMMPSLFVALLMRFPRRSSPSQRQLSMPSPMQVLQNSTPACKPLQLRCQYRLNANTHSCWSYYMTPLLTSVTVRKISFSTHLVRKAVVSGTVNVAAHGRRLPHFPNTCRSLCRFPTTWI
ncbi:hypothetical protein CONLIGDRAFT_142220 [Coniochaeta ligniaria NRRL 30616]|uniref:Uncharacterized protein n=1 Tax=Coniochaeta ligniaria NRRL 30616 TaxID=1408157 RepID=A0A1J7J734_9PEZI|nr:hypothetical protein CONLIGDRAFT_142220 [Coniochaeta ligniaria NRRL 30616]